MSQWETRSVESVVNRIVDEQFVLPVIQRRLVWNEEKMELLFDSLLKRNSFGGIMVLEEERGDQSLFAYRRFSSHGEDHDSKFEESLSETKFLVIDGQQRLQAFLMGLRGSYHDKTLFFNLLSSNDDYEFRFAHEQSELPEQETNDAGQPTAKLWYPASTLFKRLNKVEDEIQVSDEIVARYAIENGGEQKRVQANVMAFYRGIFILKSVGLSSVRVNKSKEQNERLRIVELFRRLNDGGTRLSSFDLAASTFKGYDYRMESFFKDVEEFSDIRIYQDDIIKLLFLLQDEHTKEVTDITETDVAFAIDNKERIIAALRAARLFLRQAQVFDYYASGNRSIIPLYFITYHIFHLQVETAQLESVYANYDIKNADFVHITRWLYFSLLNKVFSRGCGWIPYRTGVRKISLVMRQNKGRPFPERALFQTYANHPLRFSTDLDIEAVDRWDNRFVFSLIYKDQDVANRDVDHIQPRYRLDRSQRPKYEPAEINSLPNYQLLDPHTNRNDKRAMIFNDWIEKIPESNRHDYLQRHLIPEDSNLWKVYRFRNFRRERAKLILERVESYIPAHVARPVASVKPRITTKMYETPEGLESQIKVTLPTLRENHPIFRDLTDWYLIFRQNKLGNRWSGSYRSALNEVGIITVADFATRIVQLGLEEYGMSTNGPLYRFLYPGPDGKRTQFPTDRFGGYGWKVVMRELNNRGFRWQDYLA